MIKMRAVQLAVLSAMMSFSFSAANGFEKMGGCLIASSNCEAFRSIKKQTNPGHIRLEPGISYPLKGKNKAGGATHYQVRIDALKVPDRWVKISCGKLVKCNIGGRHESAEKTPSKRRKFRRKKYSGGKGGNKKGGNGHYLFAVSWEPAFCEGHRDKAECKSMTAQSFDATHLSLHGLWPQPRNNAYCNIDIAQKSLDRRHRWNSLAPLDLTAKTMEQLKKVMPGVKSNLQRHEWVKHGSCYQDGSAEVYFQHSIALMAQLNASAIRNLFSENIGKHISAQQIRDSFDKVYGKGSGKKVNVRCDKKGKFVSELWINLEGAINQGVTLAELLKNAKPARNSCDGGIVDPAGYK